MCAQFTEKVAFLLPDAQTYVRVWWVKKCYFFGKFSLHILWKVPYDVYHIYFSLKGNQIEKKSFFPWLLVLIVNRRVLALTRKSFWQK